MFEEQLPCVCKRTSEFDFTFFNQLTDCLMANTPLDFRQVRPFDESFMARKNLKI